MDSWCGAWCWPHASWESIPVPHCISGLPVTHLLTVFVSQSIPGHVDQQLHFLLYRNWFQSSKINQTRNLASYPYSVLTLSFKKMKQKTLRIYTGGHANYFQLWESRFASFLLPFCPGPPLWRKTRLSKKRLLLTRISNSSFYDLNLPATRNTEARIWKRLPRCWSNVRFRTSVRCFTRKSLHQ